MKIFQYLIYLFVSMITYSYFNSYIYREIYNNSHIIGIIFFPLASLLFILPISLIVGLLVFGIVSLYYDNFSMYNSQIISLLMVTVALSFSQYDERSHDELKEKFISELNYIGGEGEKLYSKRKIDPYSKIDYLLEDEDPFLFRYLQNEIYKVQNKNNDELLSSDWKNFLDFNRIKNDKDFSETLKIYNTVKAANIKNRENHIKIYQKVKNKIKTLDERDRNAFNYFFDKAWNNYIKNTEEITYINSQIIGVQFLAARDLHTNKESKYVNQYFFEIEYDLDFINNISEWSKELEYFRNRIDELKKLEYRRDSLQVLASNKLIEEFHLGIYNNYIKY